MRLIKISRKRGSKRTVLADGDYVSVGISTVHDSEPPTSTFTISLWPADTGDQETPGRYLKNGALLASGEAAEINKGKPIF